MKLFQPLIIVVCILAGPAAHAADPPPVVASASPVTNGFRFAFPEKAHLTALQLYQTGEIASPTNIGQFVLLDVVVVIERDVPVVHIEIPKELASGLKPPHQAINARLMSITTQASSRKKGERLRIEGIITATCNGAYVIYLHRFQEIQ